MRTIVDHFVQRVADVNRLVGTSLQRADLAEAGKIADLIILCKNPLERAQNYRSIYNVLKEGRVVDRSALPHPDAHSGVWASAEREGTALILTDYRLVVQASRFG